MKTPARPAVLLAVWLAALAALGAVQAQPVANPGVSGQASDQPGLAESERLRQLVWEALTLDARVRESVANAESAAQLAEQAKAGLWPQIELSAATRSAALESAGASNPGGLGVTLTYNLFDFGRTRQGILARSTQAESLRHTIEHARNTTTHETALSYLNLIRYTRLLNLQKQHVAELSVFKDKLTAIVEAFPGRRSELTQVLARLSQAENTQRDYAAQRREHQLNLLRLTGRTLEWNEGDADWPRMPDADLAQLMAQALQHPQVLSAQREALALQSDAAQTRAGLKPQIDLQVVKNATTSDSSSTSAAQLYVLARWRVFEGQAGQAQEKSQLARAQSAQERAHQLQSDIEHQLRAAWDDKATSQQRSEDLKQLAQLTDQVRRDYQDQWRELGRRSLLDVLTAESEHLATRTGQINSAMDALQAHLRLLHVAGVLRDWIVGRPS